MSPRMVPPSEDVVARSENTDLVIEVDGESVRGARGQTLAGVLLAAGRDSWRTTSRSRRPRGVFCGIGVCFDCVVTVNGERDVRACQRRAAPGDIVTVQADELPRTSS